MSRPVRRVPPVLAPVLIVLAIFGYIVGTHTGGDSHASSRTAGKPQIATGHTIVLEYPSTWTKPANTATVAGLTVGEPLTLAPRDDEAHAGLLSGQLPSDADPLPKEFLDLLEKVPTTEVINLLDVQAYKYTDLAVKGLDGALVLYVIPTPAGRSTVLACFAQREGQHGASPQLAQCEAIVATLSLVGEPAAELRPESNYGNEVGVVMTRLVGKRAELRKRMSEGQDPRKLASLASALGGEFSTTVNRLKVIEAPPAASATQAALVHAVERARDAYREFAAQAKDSNLVGYEGAKRNVEAAETEVNEALESFSMLGYGHG
ncbi:MAG TPA: hypothetical protein VGG08_08910 [Solirubrobacteraceae bacterium]|jgi:hypothetical protein